MDGNQLYNPVNSHLCGVGAKPVVASAGEIQFVDSLVSKYGSDYKAMARDHKLNYYQHTAKQIEGKIKRVQATLALAEEMGVE